MQSRRQIKNNITDEVPKGVEMLMCENVFSAHRRTFCQLKQLSRYQKQDKPSENAVLAYFGNVS